MLNLELLHRIVATLRHEWVVGTESEHSDTKTFNFAMKKIHDEMAELGVDLGRDDAYHVRAGEGGEVIFYVDMSAAELKDAAEDAEAVARNRVRAALKLHREGHNELTRSDSWPSGFCNHDGERWPCSTARVLGVEE